MRLGEGHPNGAPRRRAARLGRTAPRREGPKGRQAAHQEAEPSGLARGSTRCHPARPGPPGANPRADARRVRRPPAQPPGRTRCIRLQRRPVQSSVERAALVAEARPARMRQARAWHTQHLRIRSRRPALRGPAAALLPHAAGAGPMWPVTTWCRP